MTRSPLAYRDFRLAALAFLLSVFGLQMSAVAIGWQVYSIDGRPLDLGLVGLCEFLPLLLLALPAGHLADRVPRRTMFAVSLTIQVCVALGLVAVTSSGADELWLFLVLATATGVASALGGPAVRSLTPTLVPLQLLPRALAQRSALFQIGVIAGPAAGGLIFALDHALVYAVSAAMAATALMATLAMKAGRAPASIGAPDLDYVLAGIRLIRRSPVMFGAISLDLFAVLFGGAVALLPVFAKDILEVGPVGLGVLRSAPAVGALSMALVLSRRPVQRHAGRTLFVVVAIFGASIVVFGLSSTMWISLAALAVGGAADMVSIVMRQTILPLVTPDELRGRVSAVELVFVSASNELGAFESGVAAALVGAVPAVVIGGVATIAIALVFSRLFPDLARIDRLDELRPALEPA